MFRRPWPTNFGPADHAGILLQDREIPSHLALKVPNKVPKEMGKQEKWGNWGETGENGGKWGQMGGSGENG